jgi:1,2-diacylglycerol 3-beta-glucosyltransferase
LVVAVNPEKHIAESVKTPMMISRLPHATDRMGRKMLPPIACFFGLLGLGYWGHTFTPLQLFSFGPFLYGLVVFSIGAYRYRAGLPVRELHAEWPTVSVLIPAHNEESVIANTLKYVLGQDYPKMEVVVIDDHSTDATGQILEQFPVRVVTRRNLPDRGKSEALNAGLEVVTGEIVCVFDADSEMAPDFLRRAVAPLVRDPSLAGVQAQVRMYNRHHNFLTAAQDDEFALYNEILQVGRMTVGGASALGGNGQLTRRRAVGNVGGWSPASLTEDLDLTVRLFLAGQGRIYHATDAIVWQEGVTTLPALVRQRTRWAEGMLRCYGEFAGALLRSPNVATILRWDAIYALLSAFLPLMPPLMFVMGWMGFFAIDTAGGLPHGLIQAQSLLVVFAACLWSGVVSWRRDRRIDIMPGLRYMVFIFHWVPAVALALKNILRAKPVVWQKTVHNGHAVMIDRSQIKPASVTPERSTVSL